MSEKRTKRNPKYVTMAVCQERFNALTKQINSVGAEAKEIKRALIGDPLDPDKNNGLIAEVKLIRRRLGSSLSGKDKAAIISSIIISLAGIIVALVK